MRWYENVCEARDRVGDRYEDDERGMGTGRLLHILPRTSFLKFVQYVAVNYLFKNQDSNLSAR